MRVCPFCSTENEAFFRFCLGCGADLDEVLGSEDGATAGATASDAEAEPEAIPKPRVSAKDTAVDVPAVTPEMLAKMQAPAAKGGGRGSAKAAASPPKSAEIKAPAPPAIPAAMPSAPPPRVARERDKTIEPGGAVKPGSAASQAVAQAQGEASRRAAAAAATEQVGAGPAVAMAEAARHAEASPPAHRVAETVPPGTVEPVRTKPAPVSPVSSPISGTTSPRPTAAPANKAQPSAGTTARRAGSAEAPPPPAPQPKRAAAAKGNARLVIILEDGTDGSVLELGPETTVIGREGVDISFPHDDFLAKRHAEFAFREGVLHLRPLESTNGVFLQVHQEVELDSGDVFRIGQQLLCFELLSVVANKLEVDPRGQAIPLGSPMPEGAWGRLGQVIAPETMGSVYLLGGNEVYLGRERGDITFPGDGFVSGLHAQISMRNGRCFLKDLGSSNGTYLRLSKATPVKRGMLVLAGQQLFRVES